MEEEASSQQNKIEQDDAYSERTL